MFPNASCLLARVLLREEIGNMQVIILNKSLWGVQCARHANDSLFIFSSIPNKAAPTANEKFPPRPFTIQPFVKPDRMDDDDDATKSAGVEVSDIMQLSAVGDNAIIAAKTANEQQSSIGQYFFKQEMSGALPGRHGWRSRRDVFPNNIFKAKYHPQQ